MTSALLERKKTPIDFADSMVMIETPDLEYNEEKQTRFYDDSNPNLIVGAVTFNRTQTFDTKGQPKDKDND